MPKKQIYEKKTPREHVLLRPDMYIGSITAESQIVYVLNSDKSKMVERSVTFVPGLLKIFDEILVNAIDNKQRDKSMSYIKVDIDRIKGRISVKNDGRGIPIEIHDKYKIYIPELIFGNLLTSSNFDDKIKRVVGGRNGYGAKLTNIFSKEFIVETGDGRRLYQQKHSNNMEQKTEPKILKKRMGNFTKITFIPDFSRFGVKRITDDYFALLERRVWDMAGVSDKSVSVYLNGEKIPVGCFKDYLTYFVIDTMPILYLKVNGRWEIGVSLSDGHFKQVSYANSICTVQGGRHCDYVGDNISRYVSSKKKDLKPRQVKDFIFLFVNCLIENPAFKSQTKNELTTKIKDFGSKCEIPENFLKKIMKSQIVTEAIEMVKHKEARSRARKTDGKKTAKIFGINKLTDARFAGTKKSELCTLILVEGDSAKTLALAGLPSIEGMINQHYYGIYPLKGKVLNVREAKNKQIANNPEITNMKKIMGLRENLDYLDERNFKQLRYGRLMIMVDQDYDGSHIKGLIINLFHLFWPSLLKKRNFLVEFVTPIVVCSRRNTIKEFFTIPQYEEWKNNEEISKFEIKYYKGLGTSSNEEAVRYFSNLQKHQIKFKYEGREDDRAIELAFSKSKIEDRKEWLARFVPGTFLDHDVDYINFNSFINKELILFSMADNLRSIPSMVDGLKPGQRKILFSCLKRNITKGAKIPQLAGLVMSDAAYHHGDAALQGSIIKMAQRFVGSNNVNLLQPVGQFGSRAQGGKDAANARYISTHLSSVTRSIFNKEDDALLKYLEDDGLIIEPEWYIPVIPIVLVNGAEGIGTGWSTSVPSYNPNDVINAVKAFLDDREIPEIHPWYRGWKGDMRRIPMKRDYALVGKIRIENSHNIRITELPIKTWTDPYKSHLAKLYELGILSNINEEHLVDEIDFTLETSDANPVEEINDFMLKTLKLTGSLSLNNMVLFDKDGKIKRYSSVTEIIKEFCDIRIVFYRKRKENIIKNLEIELKQVNNKARFILAIVNKELVITNRPKREILLYLEQNGFDKIFKPNKKKTQPSASEEEVGGDDDDDKKCGYDYLLSMAIWTLTMERFDKLKRDARDLTKRLEEFRLVSIKDLWRQDLVELEEALVKFERANIPKKSSRKRKGKEKATKKRRKAPEKKANESSGDKKTKKKIGYFTSSIASSRKVSKKFSKMITNTEWDVEDVEARKSSAKPKATPKQKCSSNPSTDVTNGNQKESTKRRPDTPKETPKTPKKNSKKAPKTKKKTETNSSGGEDSLFGDYSEEGTPDGSESDGSFGGMLEKKKKAEKHGQRAAEEREAQGKLAKKSLPQKNIGDFFEKNWNCWQCTFENKWDEDLCEICGSGRESSLAL